MKLLNTALIIVAVLLVLAGCQSRHAAADADQSASSGASTDQSAGNTVAAPIVHPTFNGKEAFGFLTYQCSLGPRVPNTDAHDAAKAWIANQLTPYVDSPVVMKDFIFHDPDRRKRLELTNIIGVINPNATKKVLLFTHWDTRPTADEDLNPDNRSTPIPGADDGASGTAVLLELARTFHAKKPDVGVILLFVDGEDWGPGDDKMYLGARNFAQDPGQYRPNYAILLDMIGDKNLQIHREVTSEQLQPEIDNKVWTAARDLGYSAQFPNDTKYQIGDDHDSFNAAGIPAIDLIDFDYPYWHTLQDTPDKCSAHSLQIVGEVVARVVYLEHE